MMRLSLPLQMSSARPHGCEYAGGESSRAAIDRAFMSIESSLRAYYIVVTVYIIASNINYIYIIICNIHKLHLTLCNRKPLYGYNLNLFSFRFTQSERRLILWHDISLSCDPYAATRMYRIILFPRNVTYAVPPPPPIAYLNH